MMALPPADQTIFVVPRQMDREGIQCVQEAHFHAQLIVRTTVPTLPPMMVSGRYVSIHIQRPRNNVLFQSYKHRMIDLDRPG